VFQVPGDAKPDYMMARTLEIKSMPHRSWMPNKERDIPGIKRVDGGADVFRRFKINASRKPAQNPLAIMLKFIKYKNAVSIQFL
jgi:hypothetical protein